LYELVAPRQRILERPVPSTPKLPWTEARLSELIGQSESIRREFKSGRMFENDSENKWIANISTEVSALANTEGGELFLGIDEDKKSKPRVASILDGAPATLAPERLQQLIEGNVSPYLPGIRIQRVLLSNQPNRAVFVIQIPTGSTAYQANDGRYYGRSEFEAKYLPDHEVRLRMSRGKVARGIVLARVATVEREAEKENRIRSEVELRRARREDPSELEVERINPDGAPVLVQSASLDVLDLLSAHNAPDEVTVDFVFRNDGELTIRAPALEFQVTCNEHLFGERLVQVTRSLSRRKTMEDTIIYPGDEQAIEGSRFSVSCKREIVLAGGDCTLSWKIFLDNSPPSFGDIDLATLIEAARK
jgi:hypothetical protein